MKEIVFGKEVSIEDFFDYFEQGDYVTILFDYRKCIVKADKLEFDKKQDCMVLKAEYGTDASYNFSIGTTYGLRGNRVRLATKEEIERLIMDCKEKQYKICAEMDRKIEELENKKKQDNMLNSMTREELIELARQALNKAV